MSFTPISRFLWQGCNIKVKCHMLSCRILLRPFLDILLGSIPSITFLTTLSHSPHTPHTLDTPQPQPLPSLPFPATLFPLHRFPVSTRTPFLSVHSPFPPVLRFSLFIPCFHPYSVSLRSFPVSICSVFLSVRSPFLSNSHLYPFLPVQSVGRTATSPPINFQLQTDCA